MGPFQSITDGSLMTGLAGSITVYRITPNGRVARDSTGTITHLGGAWYNVPLSSVDLTRSPANSLNVTFSAVATGAAPVWHECLLFTSDWHAAMFGGSRLKTELASIAWDGPLVPDYIVNLVNAFDGVTGYDFPGSSIDANVYQINYNTSAAQNLRKAYDGATGYAHPFNTYPANVTSINGSATAAAVLRRANEAPVISVVAAGSPTSTAFPVSLGGTYGTGALIGRIVYFTTGARTGCSQVISASTSTLITLASALPGAPGVGDAFIIV
jgi:hypothetical protein